MFCSPSQSFSLYPLRFLYRIAPTIEPTLTAKTTKKIAPNVKIASNDNIFIPHFFLTRLVTLGNSTPHVLA